LLALEPFRSPAAAAALGKRYTVRVAAPSALRPADHAAKVLYVKLRYRLDRAFLARFPSLKAVVSPTTGLTHIDLDACRRRAVAVVSLKGDTVFLKGVSSTAELTWGLILSAERSLNAAASSVTRGSWDRDPFLGRELKGKTLGVVGLGRLGTMVARYGLAFGMRVLYSEPRRVALAGARRVTLARLMSESDIITVHVHAAPDTEGMIGRAQFAQMRRSPLFVNTARGELVDESALLSALKSGRVRGAALDVLRGEHWNTAAEKKAWLRRNKLVAYARRHPNLLLTPHIGGLTSDAVENTELFVADKLLRRR
jgi:D-3-phosphoglycerate dehydrogenase